MPTLPPSFIMPWVMGQWLLYDVQYLVHISYFLPYRNRPTVIKPITTWKASLACSLNLLRNQVHYKAKGTLLCIAVCSRQISKRIISRIRVPSVLQTKRNEIRMTQSFLLAEARNGSLLTLRRSPLSLGISLAVLWCNIRASHERKTRVDPRRDTRGSQEFPVLHPASTLLPLDTGV